MSDQDAVSPPRLCRTLDECEEAGRDLVRRNDWKLTQRQRERLTVLLRPYADQLLAADDRDT
jgi:ribosome biogenesis protein Tsr3